MQVLVTLFVSYLLAAAFSNHVFLNPGDTDWGSIWTYFWILFSLPITFVTGCAIVFLFGALLSR